MACTDGGVDRVTERPSGFNPLGVNLHEGVKRVGGDVGPYVEPRNTVVPKAEDSLHRSHLFFSFSLDIGSLARLLGAGTWILQDKVRVTGTWLELRHLHQLAHSWIARAQTDGYSDSRGKAVKTWAEVITLWDDFCLKNHQGGCPPFKALDCSLIPDERVPGPAACTHPPPDPVVVLPRAAPSPFSSTSSLSSCSSLSDSDSEATSAPLSTPLSTSLKKPLAAPKKEESAELDLFFPAPRVTPQTRVQLTPTGQARAATLREAASPPDQSLVHALARGSSSIPTPRAPPASPASPGQSFRPVTPPTATHAPHPSVLATPRPGSVAPGARAAAVAAPPARQYGIRGVAVFYPSYTAARAAASMLGLHDAKIMVSDNPDKLEAWMTNQLFQGEDGA
ncbi:hypothetical protein DFH09DRAFT_1325671 [Mycena vulgaris]|nr:hypothetical protein DFH09DRAFT_1325671 [Mycena vulgaris]